MRVLILFGIPLYLLYVGVRAIQKGWIGHWGRGKAKVFHRQTDPGMFWFLVLTLIVLSLALISAVVAFAGVV